MRFQPFEEPAAADLGEGEQDLGADRGAEPGAEEACMAREACRPSWKEERRRAPVSALRVEATSVQPGSPKAAGAS